MCSSKTSILLDAGLSAKELVRRLGKTPVAGNQLSAVVISHEHQDHVRGSGVMSRRFDLPVYLSRGTLDNLPVKTGALAAVKIFQPGNPFTVGDLEIHPFSTSHDAGESSGFIIENNGVSLGVCTDLGVATQLVRARLQGCDGLIVESNHDVNLLMDGPYPWPLKQRIRSRHGHLSNEEAMELLETVRHDRLKTVVLAHLSETNNHPRVVLRELEKLRQNELWRDVHFEVGMQHEVSRTFELP